MVMINRHIRRKPDLFLVLLLIVGVGLSVTVAYQINVYHGQNDAPVAKQSPFPSNIGG